VTPSRARLILAGGATFAVAALAAPPIAAAHGLVGRTDLPIPRWLFAWAAAVVLVVSFVGLAVLWPRPRLQEAVPERRVLRLPGPRVWEALAGAIGIALFVLVVYAGYAGTQTATANFAPTWIYVVFWVGLPIASLLFGDVFRAFNPWRAAARAVSWAASRVSRGPLPEPLPYPQRLGRWPAALGILCFAWLELVYANRDDPSTLATLSLVYAGVNLAGMSVYGIEQWTGRADAFSVYFGLFARLSPLHWEEGRLRARVPLAGAPKLPAAAGTVALLCTMIGTTSFDGFSQGPAWTDLVPHLQSFFSDLGLSSEHALEAAGTLGLICVVLIIAGLYQLGIAGMRTIGSRRDAADLAQSFAHSLIPIALAYVVAHYFSLLVYQVQALGYLGSDPLGDGSNLLGTADWTIDYGIVGATGIWYVQVAALVLGHAAGLTLAHDRALAMYRKARDATRSQYWMLAVMVGFTSLGLWLLSAQSS
jgi:hypothetical protein